MTEPFDSMRWYDQDGRPTKFGPLSVVEDLKHPTSGVSKDTIRQVCRVTDGERDLVLKRRWMNSLGRRLTATCGRSPLHNEKHMITVAQSAGLAVAPLIGWGEQRTAGLVEYFALLIQWAEGRTTLGDLVVRALDSGDDQGVRTVQSLLIRFLARLRNAGLADRDFGTHNILVAGHDLADSAVVEDLLWVDLEGVYRARCDAAAATCQTVAAALSNWWTTTRAHPPHLISALDEIRRTVPEPCGGWSAIAPSLNRQLQKRVDKSIRYGRVDRRPPRLELERGA